MAFENSELKVREVAERIAASNGLEVVEVELRGGSGKGGRVLRVFVEKNAAGRKALAEQAGQSDGDLKLPSSVGVDQLAGVTHDDLANFSQELSTILDVEDAVPGSAYTLEVSSPGLDRKLYTAADYQRFQGSLVKLMTREPVNGNRHYQGRIKSVEDATITVALEEKKPKPGKQAHAAELMLPLNNIEKARLVPEV